MLDAEISSIQSRILDLFFDLEDSDLSLLEEWISSQKYKKDLEKKKAYKKSEKMLTKISKAVKKLVPFEAELPSEKIVPPSVGEHADCNKENTIHIDEFLHDEDDIEKLVQDGKIRRHYCLDCKSHNIKDLIFISHSKSKQVLQYIYKVLLPKDLKGQQILDVGSRLGPVIFAAYHLTNASRIIGVEMNKECCEIQEKIIDLFSMDSDRIKVIHSDVLDRKDIVESSNIIVINNVDFFVDVEKHKEMWYFFKKYISKSAFLVTNRSMPETLSALDLMEEFDDWLTVCPPNQMENEIMFDIEDCSDLFVYSIN